ncbi:MAG: alginate export family protein [Candidatus Aminicenantes bacterium]|nr:MAG: alginate export family protein [Candidatus Aminicenantes bacterium]
MKKLIGFGLVLLFLQGTSAADDLRETIEYGKVSLDARYRFEFVDQDGLDNNATASTLRLRLGYTTKDFYGFHLHLDLETIHVVGFGDYNSTDNGKIEYPVVADPDDTELNQAYLDYTGIANFAFRLGRQKIILDNARFIGNVGWRQNEQTFDAFKFVNTSLQDFTFILSYFSRVNRIFGAHHSRLSHIDLDAFVFHVNYKFFLGGLSAYAHFFDNNNNPDNSHQNFGLRFAGNYGIADDITVLYALELATQHDYEQGSEFIRATYRFLELGCNWTRFTAKVGYEVLGGDGKYGFSTPFATLHAFNGWADKFLATPLNGIQDIYFLAGANLEVLQRPLVLKLVYHDFRSDNDSIRYGSELDVMAQMTVLERLDVLLKFAGYNADSHASDTTKFWVSLHYRF